MKRAKTSLVDGGVAVEILCDGDALPIIDIRKSEGHLTGRIPNIPGKTFKVKVSGRRIPEGRLLVVAWNGFNVVNGKPIAQAEFVGYRLKEDRTLTTFTDQEVGEVSPFIFPPDDSQAVLAGGHLFIAVYAVKSVTPISEGVRAGGGSRRNPDPVPFLCEPDEDSAVAFELRYDETEADEDDDEEDETETYVPRARSARERAFSKALRERFTTALKKKSPKRIPRRTLAN